ncbi:MAG TPA: hypothetical protein PLI95_09850, partial [Polyangiaceae bacterium]|nr:hypothetical protein [Polyangiaceae bacterium]
MNRAVLLLLGAASLMACGGEPFSAAADAGTDSSKDGSGGGAAGQAGSAGSSGAAGQAGAAAGGSDGGVGGSA